MRDPFFVVGTGRCGSTLLRNLLCAHPDVYLPNETHWLPILFHMYGTQHVPLESVFDTINHVYMAKGRTALRRILDENELHPLVLQRAIQQRLEGRAATIAETMAAFYRVLALHNDAGLYGDKTPDYGLCMSTIQTMWPNAMFVHIHRDGRDVALSMADVLSFRVLATAGINHWWGIAYGEHYRAYLAAAEGEQPIERFLHLWHSRKTRIDDEATRLRRGTYLSVAYEHLMDHPGATLAEIAAFLGLPDRAGWPDAALNGIDLARRARRRGTADFDRLESVYARLGV
jgi:hypothetical protein